MVYFYSLIFKRILIQLNGNSYKEPLRYLISEKAFNAGFPYFMSTQSAAQRMVSAQTIFACQEV